MSNLFDVKKTMHLLKRGSLVDFMVYLFTDGLNKCIPFISIPIIAYYLDPEEIGLMTNFNVLVQFLLPIITMGTSTYLTVVFFKLTKEQIKGFYSSQVSLILILFLVILLFEPLWSSFVYKALKIDLQWQLIAVICVFGLAFINLFLSYLRIVKKTYIFGIVQVVQSFILFFVTIILISHFNWDWAGKAIGYLFSSIIISFFVLYMLKRWNMINIFLTRKDTIKQTVNFALPMLPHNLSFWFKSGVDKIIITQFCGLSQNGIYSVALNFGAVISLFTTSFFNVYSPYIYNKLALIDQGRVNAKEILYKQMKIAFLFSICLLLLILLVYFFLYYLIPILFNEKYASTIEYLPYILATVYFNALYSMFSVYLFYRKKTKLLGTITFSMTLFQVLITYILVHYIGIYGALFSSVLISIIIFVAVFMASNNLYNLIDAVKTYY